MSTIDERSRALRLIEYRALNAIRTSSPGPEEYLRAIEDHQLAGLLHAVLELFASVRAVLRTELASGLVDVALQERAIHVALSQVEADRNLAGELIIAHEQASDALDDNFVRDHGADNFNRGIDQIHDRFYETILAVVDVWLELLPELRTAEGMQLLGKHAEELD